MSAPYYRGFRVGLAATDDPISDQLGTPSQAISAVERFVAEEGPSWERGFWNGVATQPKYLEACLKIDICHSMCSGRVMLQKREHDWIAVSTTDPDLYATDESPGKSIWKLNEAYPHLGLTSGQEEE